MCGIVGILALQERGKIYLPKIQSAVKSLSHRGPDSNHVSFPDEHTALGHARLSIIDLSEQSDQPFKDSNDDVHIVYNGEFFNYKELKVVLENEGHSFRTVGDVEVLLKLYIQKGEKCLSDISGFFAFSIYDVKRSKLFVARDRFGVKPLYYFRNEEIFCWSSELNAIHKIIEDLKLNHQVLLPYLQFNYLAGTDSFYQEVKRLEPGHLISIENGEVNIKRYFTQKITKLNSTHEEAKQNVRLLLEKAVEERMIADVSVGSFLSGGIDSTIVTGIASSLTPKLNTFSIGFKDNPQYDESSSAEVVAKKYNTNHHCLMLSNTDLLSSLDDFLNQIDEPFADSSALNVYLLSKFARQHVKVALSGDGADEIFAGYNKHRAEWMIRNKPFFNQLLKISSPFSSFLPASRQGVLYNKLRQMKRYQYGLSLDDKERYWQWASLIQHHQAKELLLHGEEPNQSYDKIKSKYTSLLDGSLNSVLLSDVNMVLPFDMLTKVDMMSMAHGLEVRSPFMDYKLIDYVFSIREEFKIDANGQKLILKEAFQHLIPNELINKKKHGFEVPLQQWFAVELKSRIDNEWLSAAFIKEQGIFNYDKVVELKKRIGTSNASDAAASIWALIVFNHWWKKNLMN